LNEVETLQGPLGVDPLEVGLVTPDGETCLVHAWPDFEIFDGRRHVADAGDRTGGPESGGVVVLPPRQLPFHLGACALAD